MAVPKRPFDVARNVAARLSPIEREVLRLCERAAAEGRLLESIEEMRHGLGALSYSTVPGIMKRLEAKGYISRKVFQRGRQVCITATGQCTAPPSNTAPHWRFRVETPPTPAIQAVRERARSMAELIESEARQLGKPLSVFLADLVYIGWHGYKAEKEQDE